MERRFKALTVTNDVMAEWIRAGSDGRVTSDAPQDLAVLAVFQGPHAVGAVFQVVVHSESFPVVPDDVLLPVLEVQYTREVSRGTQSDSS